MQRVIILLVATVFLYSCKSDPSAQKDVFKFARMGKLDEMKGLLANGTDPNQQTDADKKSPLHFAASKGDTAMMTLLIANGANLEIRDVDNLTPLFYAAKSFFNPRESIRFLVKAGADINAKNKDGLTLWCSLWQSKASFLTKSEQEIAHALLEAKANIPKIIDQEGRTLLHLAAAYIESSKVIRDIIKNYKFEPDVKDNNGWTPMHFAALKNNGEALTGLLQNGANVNAQTEKFIGKSHKRKSFVDWSYRYEIGSTPYDIYRTISSRTGRNEISLKKIFEEYGGEQRIEKRRINDLKLKIEYHCK